MHASSQLARIHTHARVRTQHGCSSTAVVLLVPMELTLFQILAAAVCLAVALVGLAMPALLRHSASALSIGNCLAAGCILGGGLLHLLPDAANRSRTSAVTIRRGTSSSRWDCCCRS